MTATVSNDRSEGRDGADTTDGADLRWYDGVLATAPADGGDLRPDVQALVAAAGRTTDGPLPVVLDLTGAADDDDALGDLVLSVDAVLTRDAPDARDVLLLTPGAADADPTAPDAPAALLAAVTGRTVIAASTTVTGHPQGGFVAQESGRFVSSDGAVFGSLFPRPAWAEHVPAQSAFVGEAGLLDPVPAGVWIHADPSARSPQQRLGALVHGVPPVPLWSVIVLGTPGGPTLDLDAVATALAARPALLERSVIVPFGVSLTELGLLADRLGHGFDAVTAMVVTSETGAAVVRTVGRDARFGWTPLVSRIRLEPGGAAPVATVSRSPVRVEDLGGDTSDISLDVVPAGLWLRTAQTEPGAVAGDDDPRRADIQPDGVRLFVGDPGVPTPTSLVQRAAALLGRLDPALRQGARIVMVGAPAGAPTRPPAAEPAPVEPVGPDPEPAAEPEPAPRETPSLLPPTGAAGDFDRVRVREALGPIYGRLGGRTGVVLALEPGRGLGDGSARDDLVALAAVLTHAEGTDPRLGHALDAAFADGGARLALLLCASAGAESLATHRGIAFASLSGETVPLPDDELAAPPFGRLALTRPDVVGPGTVVLAVRCRTVRRLGGLITADSGAELLAPPGLRLRVTAVVPDAGAGTLVLADEIDAGRAADAAWFDGRTEPTEDAPELPSW